MHQKTPRIICFTINKSTTKQYICINLLKSCLKECSSLGTHEHISLVNSQIPLKNLLIHSAKLEKKTSSFKDIKMGGYSQTFIFKREFKWSHAW